MNSIDPTWGQRVDDLWRGIGNHPPGAVVELMRRLTDELPPGSPVRSFEFGSAQDSTGHPELAAPLYRAAFSAGLAGIRRRRATIQLASSLRNLGQPAAAAALLTAEVDAGSDELDGAVRVFLALALADIGREREALVHALAALSQYLPRYQRSLARYADELWPSPG